MVSILREKFADLKLTYSIGGQISFDVFPEVLQSSCSCCVKPSQLCLSLHGKIGLDRKAMRARICCRFKPIHPYVLLMFVALAGLGQDILPAVCRERFPRNPFLWRQDIPGEIEPHCQGGDYTAVLLGLVFLE